MAKNYRANWHDYRSRSIYHITLLKNPTMPPFGRIAGDCDVPVGTKGSPYLASTLLGTAVKNALREIANIHPALRLYQYALMPDHLHLLLSVESYLDEILGRKIGRLKNIVNKNAGTIGVFEEGFHDQILMKERSLNCIYKYLRENPYRLAIRQKHPDFFHRHTNLTIDGKRCSAYGNIHLLENPFKMQVQVHRTDGEEIYAHKKERWLHTAANGGVLVSPFISQREKDIRNEATELAGRFILLTNRPFKEREKPSGKDFELCSKGRMLIISPAEELEFGRKACMAMNALATAIVEGHQRLSIETREECLAGEGGE